MSILSECRHFYGRDDESLITERMAAYRVNGVAGSGICEWQARNMVARGEDRTRQKK